MTDESHASYSSGVEKQKAVVFLIMPRIWTLNTNPKHYKTVYFEISPAALRSASVITLEEQNWLNCNMLRDHSKFSKVKHRFR